MATHFRGPLRYSGVGGPPALKVGQSYPYLNDCRLHDIDGLPRLPVLNDEARFFGVQFEAAQYPGPYAVGASGGWALAGSGCTVADQDVLGASTLLATTATDELQAKLATKTIFKLVAGKRIWCSMRFALPLVANGAFLFGLVDAVPADITAAIADIDGIYFHKTDAGTTTQFRVQNDTAISTLTAVETLSGGVALADDVFHEYGFLVDTSAGGMGPIHAFVDGKLAGSVSSTSANRPDVLMQFAIARQAEGANIVGVNIAHLLCIQEL